MIKRTDIEIQKRIERWRAEMADAKRRSMKDPDSEYGRRQLQIVERRRIMLNELYWLTGEPPIPRNAI